MLDFEQNIKENVRTIINHPGWKDGLKIVLQDYIDELTKRIVGDSNEELSEEQRNDLIRIRRCYRNLLNLPERILGEEEEPEKINYDPYKKPT